MKEGEKECINELINLFMTSDKRIKSIRINKNLSYNLENIMVFASSFSLQHKYIGESLLTSLFTVFLVSMTQLIEAVAVYMN